MRYDKEQIAAKLVRWEKYMNGFYFPQWDELPDFDLYMDQVVALVGKYLDLLPHSESFEPIITPSTINNYVRIRIMPAPVKKKYGRIHLAYLIIICTLKQSLNISFVSRLIPMGLSEDEVRNIYSDFIAQHKTTSMLCVSQIKSDAASVLDPNEHSDAGVKTLVMNSAIYSNMYKLLTEKIIALQIDPVPELPVSEAE